MCFFKPFPVIANKALEEKMQEMNCNSDKNVTALKERVQVLEKELDNANELLSSSKLRGLIFFPLLLVCTYEGHLIKKFALN